MGLKNEKCVNNNLFVLLNKLSSIYFGNQFRYKYSFIVTLSENKNKQITLIVLKEVYLFTFWQKKGKIKYPVTFLIKFL